MCHQLWSNTAHNTLCADALIQKELIHDGITDVWNYSTCLQFGVSSMTGPDGSNVAERSYPHDRAFQYSHGGLDGRGGLTYRTAQRNSQGSEVVVVYLQMGKIVNTTNPQRAAAAGTDGWTRTTKDDLGRVTTVETLSGRYQSGTLTGTVGTTYNANATTVTDQAGKVRRSIVDGLGRLVRVDEPDASGALGSVTSPIQPTNYTYDSQGNLTQVAQGIQTRSFVYDGLSRLKQATNPESGTITYDYYKNGNLWHRTDARGTITFDYDGLNRVKTRTYGDPATPDVNYDYDTLGAALNGKGRLTSVSSSVSSYSYASYDVMARVLTGTQTTDGNAYSMSYQYNLAGGMTSETYPSGQIVTTGYDSAGRISTVTGQKSGEANKTYASGYTYTAHGAVGSMTLGNGLIEGTTFNSRLQPTFIKLGTVSNPTSVLQLGYEYTSSCQAGNNGNVMRQTITAPGLGLTQDYCYDSLNRLSSASEMAAFFISSTRCLSVHRTEPVSRTAERVRLSGLHRNSTIPASSREGF